jgi:hypothetical protein
MNIKRKTYIGLGILLNLIELAAPLMERGWWILGGYLLVIAYLIIVTLIYYSVDRWPPSLWFESSKKIYHARFDELYAEVVEKDRDGKMVWIYEQRWLNLKLIAKVGYTDDIETMKARLKRHLDDVAHKRMTKDPFHEWDGYLDSESKRDNKLNKLGI